MHRLALVVFAVTLLAACSKPSEQRTQPPPGAPSPPLAPIAPKAPPLPPQPRPAPRPTIDPKSNAAAEELVRGFVRLINAGRLNDAYMLLRPNAPPRADFDGEFAGYSHLHATLGAAGDQEGAAGSIYLSVPLTVSGDKNGKHVERSATAIVRRVNDVPGSTEAQRHWHIEWIDWK